MDSAARLGARLRRVDDPCWSRDVGANAGVVATGFSFCLFVVAALAQQYAFYNLFTPERTFSAH